jgi:hypothetical protein
MTILQAHASPEGFWTADGSIALGTFPGGVLEQIPEDIPICLQRGNAEWGQIHIDRKHGHWLKKHHMSAAQMVWLKCQHTGTVYGTEGVGSKFKINLVLHPQALMVLRHMTGQRPYFRVISIYLKTDSIDGENLGRFVGKAWAGDTPTFEPPPEPKATSVIYKKKRLIIPE